MKCPICGMTSKTIDLECKCGEMLAPWRTIALAGESLRQRGLALASDGDYMGACISFLEAFLSNPMDETSLVDVARSLFHLGRRDDALRLLAFAANHAPNGMAESVAEAIRSISKQPCGGQSRSEVRTDEQRNEVGNRAQTPIKNDKFPRSIATQSETTRSHETTKEDASAQTDIHDAGRQHLRRPTTDAAPAEAANAPRPAGRPFLAFEALKMSTHWFPALKGRTRVDPMWLTVIEMERGWNGQWNALTPWLTAARPVSHEQSVIDYMLGLAAWQRDDFESASERFAACVKQRPPLFNPAAYYLCVSLLDLDSAAKVNSSLRNEYGDRGIERLIDHLRRRLEEWNETRLLDALRKLGIQQAHRS